MKDYYKTLGVEKSASKDDIKKAFRKLAHENHPDKNKDNPAAMQKFKEASEAYSVLSDDAKRTQYDRFGSAGPGFQPGSGAGGNPFQGGFNGAGFDFSQFTQNGGFHFSQNGVEFDLGDIFGDIFGGGGGRNRRPRKGSNVTVDVQLSFKESIFGIDKDIAVHGEHLTVKIPPGIENGQGLRVPGKGEAGQPPAQDKNGPAGPSGDLIVRVWVSDHGTIRKEGFNLVTELPIKLTLALAGGTITLATLDGEIELKIPTGTSHGEILRVKGKGVPYETAGLMSTKSRRGDLLVVTHVIMPRKLSKNAQRLIDDLKKEGL